MLESDASRHSSARRSLKEAFLDQVRLVHVLQGIALLADGGRKRFNADRPPVELVDDREEELAVHPVEAAVIDLEERERRLRDRAIDPALGLDLGEIAHALEQAVGDARRAARAARDLLGARGVDLDAEK